MALKSKPSKRASKVTTTREELFAAVYAAPDDDAPRAVLADYLQTIGDPQGELIALQLAPLTAATEARIKTLLRKPAALCAPVVWRMLSVKSVRFERGFVASGALAAHRKTSWQEATGAVEWATVHTLDLHSFSGTGHLDKRRERELETRMLSFIHDPAMRHLRRAGPLNTEEVALLLAHGVPLPWRELAFGRGYGREGSLDALAGARTVFPAVTHLDLRLSVAGLRQLLDRAAWLRELAKLTLAGDCRSEVAAVRALGIPVETVEPVAPAPRESTWLDPEEFDRLFDSQLR